MTTLQARRQRDTEARQERALLDMQQAVVSAIIVRHPDAADAADDAVCEAIAQLVKDRGYLADPLEVRNRLFRRADCRMIDTARLAESRKRDPVAIDENAQALLLSVSGDLAELTWEARVKWRTREILSVLSPKERLWAETMLDRGTRCGVGEALGWSPSTTRDVTRRATLKMKKFVNDRDSGVICQERRPLLDAFILATARRPDAEVTQDDFTGVLFHLAGCEDCWAAWHVRRRSLLGRYVVIFTFPLSHVAAAAAALRDRLARVLGDADTATFTMRQRLGMGGGTAATGGGVAMFGSKAAVVCAAAVCAVGGGAAAVISAVPAAILAGAAGAVHPNAAHHTAHAAASARAAPAAVVQVPAPVVTQPVTLAAAPVKRAAPAATTRDPSYTPGDLIPSASSPASSTPAAAPSSSTAAPVDHSSAPPASGASTCYPGDLGC